MTNLTLPNWCIVLPLTSLITILCMLYSTFKYSKLTHTSLNINATLYYLGLIFLAMAVAAFLSYTINSFFFCEGNADIYFKINTICFFFYLVQERCLLLLLFYRLYYIFHGTSHVLEKGTIIAFSVLFILAVFIGGMLYIVYIQLYSIPWAIWIVSLHGLVIVSLNLVLVTVIIYKLVMMRRDAHINKHTFGDITKIFSLTFISIISNILTLITSIAIMFIGRSAKTEFIWQLVIDIDIYTNFLSILLGYKHFNDYFCKLCNLIRSNLSGCICDASNRKLSYRSQPISIDGSSSNSSNDKYECKIPLQNETGHSTQLIKNNDTKSNVSSKNESETDASAYTLCASSVKFSISDARFTTANDDYIEQCRAIYAILTEFSINCHFLDSNTCQIIAKYSATLSSKCRECFKSFSYIECFEDYYIVNGALANLDEHSQVRYYLNCEPSYSKIFGGRSKSGTKSIQISEIEILCIQCGLKWKCNSCSLQFLNYSQESLLIDGGCDVCKCNICEDCVHEMDNQIICDSCYYGRRRKRAEESSSTITPYNSSSHTKYLKMSKYSKRESQSTTKSSTKSSEKESKSNNM